MKKLFRFFILLSLFIPCLGKSGCAQTVNYTVHANIIYRLTKYIDWPESKSEDFVIGVFGDSPVYEELKKLTAGKTVGSRKIIILNFSSLQNHYNCQILFISEYESSLLKKIIASEPNTPVLIVTEEHGLCSKGSCINFIDDDDKLKLEINKNNIEKRSLKIASELLSLGTIIK